MNGTTARQSAEKALATRLGGSDGATWTNLLGLTLTRMGAGFYGSLLDVFGQTFYGRHDMTDAFCFSQLYAYTLTGKVGICKFGLDAPPHRDSATEANNEILASLGEGFRAKFSGGYGSGSDGMFYWDKPITVSVLDENGHESFTTIEAGECELEVGYQALDKTLLQLKQSRALARWPYGHDYITLLVALTPFEQPDIPYVWDD